MTNSLERTTLFGYRFYKISDEKYYPSITSILGDTVAEDKKQSLQRWQDSLGSQKADKILKDAGISGTAVHLLAERYLKKEPLNEKQFDAKDLNRFNALKIKLNLITDIIGQELSLYSDKLEIAGTTDCIAKYKGITSIIDFKTSNKIKDNNKIHDYKLQCCFYAQAYNELYNANINQGVILMTAETGFPLEFVFELEPYLPELKERIKVFYTKINSLL